MIQHNLNQELETTLDNVLEATSIYLAYIEKYSKNWDSNNDKVSKETCGKLIIFANQIKEIQDNQEKVVEEEEKTMIINCLFDINHFSNYIKNSLRLFVD